MRQFYADLHIHIGCTEGGSPVKISASRKLTFYNIAREASLHKGMDIIGIIDCHSPYVLKDIERYLQAGEMTELSGGGLAFRNTTILLGCELEVRDEGMNGPAHLLVFLPYLKEMKKFSDWLSRHMTNVHLSSQRLYTTSRQLQQIVSAYGGIVIPAHIFTPHKSMYGVASHRMHPFLDLEQIYAVELGLSADAEMAGHLSELNNMTFLSNSDAHSLTNIGREYNVFRLKRPDFNEFKKAIQRQDGRQVIANYGLNPRLGKYHRTYCVNCEQVLDDEHFLSLSLEDARCPKCHSRKFVTGVMERILQIADQPQSVFPPHRSNYYYQVPLSFIPGLGKKTMMKLLDHFGTEMNILHQVNTKQLAEVVGPKITAYIDQARNGTLMFNAGGGGRYGTVQSSV